MIVPLSAVLPWVALALFVAFRVRLPPELPAAADLHRRAGDAPAGDAPLVSVVIPARNEAHNILRVLRSVTASRYPAFEVIVVDDRSDDRTDELARSVDAGRARRLQVLAGAPLPAGWLGKPWACWQGARHARGELILFTDADTVHGPDLMGRAVAALGGDALERTGTGEPAGVVTVVGRQLTETFWEKLVQPQIFLTMALRYFDTRRPFVPERWRSAIANGQYILFRRAVYDDVGGHARVRHEVAEDLRLAQELVHDGHGLLFRRAENDLATRMYRSLAEIVAGWSKNVIPGGRQTLPGWLRPAAAPAMVLGGVGLWLVPPAVLVSPVGTRLGVWAAATVAVSLVFWTAVYRRFGVAWRYGLLYPVGAAVGTWIVLRSWLGARRVQWKGRTLE